MWVNNIVSQKMDFMANIIFLNQWTIHLQGDYLSHEFLFDNLKPEFKSRYAINTYVHPCLRTMTRMLQVSLEISFSFHIDIVDFYSLMYAFYLKRKMLAVYYQKCTEWISQLLIQLIKHKPYIEVLVRIVIFLSLGHIKLSFSFAAHRLLAEHFGAYWGKLWISLWPSAI